MASHAVRSAAKIAGCGLLYTIGAHQPLHRPIERLDSHPRSRSSTRPMDYPFTAELCIASVFFFSSDHFKSCRQCWPLDTSKAELDAHVENMEKMRLDMRHADPEKVAEWDQAGTVLQESMIGGSPGGVRRDAFPWPITEEFLDAGLNNVRVMREFMNEAAKKKLLWGIR